MAFFWLVLVLSIVVTNYADVVMKIHVNDKLPAGKRFSWWSRNSWVVARKYKEFYPDSYLPLISLGSFLLCLALLAFILARQLWEPN